MTEFYSKKFFLRIFKLKTILLPNHFANTLHVRYNDNDYKYNFMNMLRIIIIEDIQWI